MAHNMNRNPAAGTGKVFWFSLRQMLCSKGWLGSTIVIAALLLLGIPLLLLGISAASVKEDDGDDETPIRSVFVVDETEGEADYNALNDYYQEEYNFTLCASMDAAISASAGQSDAVILRVTKPAETYSLTVYLTQVTEISRSKASRFGEAVRSGFAAILMQKAELTPEGVALLSMPVATETAALSTDAGEEADDEDIMAEIIGAVVPFLMLMLVYMMVVLYGQSMANSVMLEKTSKLMETILTAVHPFALMAGKLLATASAAVMQLLIWLFSLIGGCVSGALFALRMIPDTDSGVVLTINAAADQISAISVSGIFISIGFLALGFLLYLSLAAVSGALASKTEDLNKTNVVFTLVIVVSFILCLSGSAEAMEAADNGQFSLLSDAMWLKFFPFTAILVMPGELILDRASLGVTCGSAACLIVSVILFVALAAVIYKLLVLYRGAPPKPKQLLAMLKENKK